MSAALIDIADICRYLTSQVIDIADISGDRYSWCAAMHARQHEAIIEQVRRDARQAT
jgi:hypothetical protein